MATAKAQAQARAQGQALQKASRRPQPLRDVSRRFIPPDAPPATDPGVEAEAMRFNRPSATAVPVGPSRRRMTPEAVEAAQRRMRPPEPEPTEPAEDQGPDTDDGEDVAPDTQAETYVPPQPPPPSLPPAARHETAAPAATTQSNPVALTAISLADGDALWDWVRADEDHGRTLFGRAVASSVELHVCLQQLALDERDGRAAIRALHVQGRLVGFVELNPILAGERVAVVTVYLGPAARPLHADLVPFVIEALAAVPYHLAFPAPTAAWAELYRRVLPEGFREQTLFVK